MSACLLAASRDAKRETCKQALQAYVNLRPKRGTHRECKYDTLVPSGHFLFVWSSVCLFSAQVEAQAKTEPEVCLDALERQTKQRVFGQIEGRTITRKRGDAPQVKASAVESRAVEQRR